MYGVFLATVKVFTKSSATNATEELYKSQKIIDVLHLTDNTYHASSSESSSASSSHFKNGSLAFLTFLLVSLSTYFLLT